MRYTSTYQNGIESVDRRYKIFIGTLGYEGLRDVGQVLFCRKELSNGDIEIICRCEAAVSRNIYELVALSIQDDQSVTGTHLYRAIKMLAKHCSSLWSEGKDDPRIEENFI